MEGGACWAWAAGLPTSPDLLPVPSVGRNLHTGDMAVHPIKLDELRVLYQSMKSAQRFRVQFEHRHPNNGARFVVVFLADESPFKLIIVAKGKVPLVLVVSVHQGFLVYPWLEGADVVAKLKRILGVVAGGEESFSVSKFFRELARSAPKHVTSTADANPAVVARYYNDVDEADKVYFLHFMLHKGNRHASKINLDKTRKLLGEKCYRECLERNISSCWSADPAEEQPWQEGRARYLQEDQD